MILLRENCPMRHPENGNCMPAGGFCTAVNDSVCEALHSAYDLGGCDLLRAAKNRVAEGAVCPVCGTTQTMRSRCGCKPGLPGLRYSQTGRRKFL